MKNKVYITAPLSEVSYRDQSVHVSFIASQLAQRGYETVNIFDVVKVPYEISPQLLGKAVETLIGCDHIYLCKGWQQSPWCVSEMQVALNFGLDIMTEI